MLIKRANTLLLASGFIEKDGCPPSGKNKWQKYARVEIYYNEIGKIDLPIEKAQLHSGINLFATTLFYLGI